jgi:hypothetical protein
VAAPQEFEVSTDAVLCRVTEIRSTGAARWLARCPAHDDRDPSLSIRELPDGRVLLYCFAGCATADVLDALALDWADLDAPHDRRSSAVTRPRPWKGRYPPAALLEIVSEEVTVVAIVAADLLAHRSTSAEDWQRLALAVARIQRVRDCIQMARAA